MLIIIAGMPASGKSTIATKLSKSLNLPIIEKDAIKEELFDTIGFNNYAQKRQLDVAATAVLIRLCDSLLKIDTSLIVVNNFRSDLSDTVKDLIDRHKASCITLFFKGDADVFYKRYVERDLKHKRHLGHILQDRFPPLEGDSLDYTMTREEFAEKFEKLGMDEFDIGGVRIEIDATNPEKIDVDSLIEQIKNHIENDEGGIK